ncbi:DUF6879 family protein [Actinacidiphila epipremni]|jgi:hypothetical protein|uniref:DUF6879 domain-containing protein n=1 Tax=Actinacidiphila epipremni TaxID=2053013 RepID=A0ABX0ZHW8_9ACTN|nr:DUF6879 family protein [Actinacidiphila epipremni]NJP42645.1 hypothetical protein [Actinacidiphila epipremni]
MQPRAWTFEELLAGATRSAVHLEMRDVYYSNPRFEAWRQGQRVDWADRASWWRPFHQDIADAVGRGVRVRRARVVCEPVSEYIRWEHYVTEANVRAGEQVRWLPRRETGSLLMPGRDFWVFDDQVVRYSDFGGDGAYVGEEFTDDPGVVALSAAAFERVWERAVPHEDFEIE